MESNLYLMQLQADQLWHTDSTLVPWLTLASILAVRMPPTSGGEPEFESTHAACPTFPKP